jgi:hypothetical protein
VILPAGRVLGDRDLEPERRLRSDALAAQVGGIGIAPGAMSDSVAMFEATHGTAPKCWQGLRQSGLGNSLGRDDAAPPAASRCRSHHQLDEVDPSKKDHDARLPRTRAVHDIDHRR